MEAPGGALFALKEPALLIRRILASLAASALFAVPGPQGFAGELEALAPHGPVGLGRLLTTKDGGQIFVFVIEPKNGDRPDLIVSDIAANTFSHVFHLDPDLFGLGNGPKLGQFTRAGKAVLALSPDGGTVHGLPPVNVLIDLTSGKTVQF